jgi:hypothetical protein
LQSSSRTIKLAVAAVAVVVVVVVAVAGETWEGACMVFAHGSNCTRTIELIGYTASGSNHTRRDFGRPCLPMLVSMLMPMLLPMELSVAGLQQVERQVGR